MLCSGCVVGVVMFSRVSVYCVSVLKGVWVGVWVSVFVLCCGAVVCVCVLCERRETSDIEQKPEKLACYQFHFE